MKIFLSPQNKDEKIKYVFDNEKITAIIGEQKDVFDFAGLPDGILDPDSEVETTLPVNPILFAEKKEGELYITLLNWVDSESDESELFPVWIDSSEYVPPKIKEDAENGEI